jgi:signal transduction histidine kinase
MTECAPGISPPGGSRRKLTRSLLHYLGYLLLIVGVAVFDLSTPPNISLTIFYLIPVLLAAWFEGRTAGYVLSVASALAWFIEDTQEHSYTYSAAAYWETAARLAIYFLITYLISRLQKSIQQARATNAELERMVSERTRALESNLQDLKEFTYTMAHDLRAPARAVHGLTALLREDYGEAFDAAGFDCLDRISGAGDRMDQLVLELLSYASLIHRPIVVGTVELRPVIDTVTSSMTNVLSQRKAEVHSDGQLPAVRGEKALVEEILSHLVSNALVDVEEDKSPQIEIRGDRHNGAVRIQVRDNGAAIPTELWGRLVRPGERLRPGAGTGMSLAIARKAAERMGGRLGAEPVGRNGNCVWIELPAA